MRIIVSACLLGHNCKYNGGNNYNEKVAEYIKGHEVIPVCPEVFGGLPTPRVPSEIVCGIVTNREGRIVDEQFRRGAKLALQIAVERKADLAILQHRSPSCGAREVYDGTFTGHKIPGKGIFAQMLAEQGIPMMEPEDL